MQRDEDANFHFDESYATRRRKHLSFPYAQCPKILLNSSISRFSRNETKETVHQYTIHGPPHEGGGKNLEFKTKKCQKSCNFTTSNARMPPI
jgi:hypothetical protein